MPEQSRHDWHLAAAEPGRGCPPPPRCHGGQQHAIGTRSPTPRGHYDPYAADMPPGSRGHFFYFCPWPRFLLVFCFFDLFAHHKIGCRDPQKVTEGAIFRQIVLYGNYVDSSGVCFAVCRTSQCRGWQCLRTTESPPYRARGRNHRKNMFLRTF